MSRNAVSSSRRTDTFSELQQAEVRSHALPCRIAQWQPFDSSFESTDPRTQRTRALRFLVRYHLWNWGKHRAFAVTDHTRIFDLLDVALSQQSLGKGNRITEKVTEMPRS